MGRLFRACVASFLVISSFSTVNADTYPPTWKIVRAVRFISRR